LKIYSQLSSYDHPGISVSVSLPGASIAILGKSLVFLAAGLTYKYPGLSLSELDPVEGGKFFFTGMADFCLHSKNAFAGYGLGFPMDLVVPYPRCPHR